MSEAGLPRRRTARRGAVLAAGLVLSTVALAGCGGDDGQGGGAPSPPAAAAPGSVTTAPDGVQEVTIETPAGYVFSPDAFTVAPGRVRLTVVNTDEQMVHNFRFTPGAGPAEIEEQIPLLQAGESSTIEFEVSEAGDYPFDCSFHIQLGQVGTMTVAG
ncbi:cupredoxin domain-containing protein [Trujillonella humicola]|uniref:cupredoxin domain-containing protein n=1 Tax=Trujillonella humicola TaxID=3383699 RepID=UPI003905E1F6